MRTCSHGSERKREDEKVDILQPLIYDTRMQ